MGRVHSRGSRGASGNLFQPLERLPVTIVYNPLWYLLGALLHLVLSAFAHSTFLVFSSLTIQKCLVNALFETQSPCHKHELGTRPSWVAAE